MSDIENVAVSIGAGVIVKKTRGEAREILEKRLGEIKKVLSETEKTIESYINEISKLEIELNEVLAKKSE